MRLADPTSDSFFVRVAEWAASALGGALLAFLGSLVTFRTRLYSLKRDIDDEKKAREAHRDAVDERLLEIEERIATSMESIQRSISDRHNSDTATEARGETKTREALNAIRQDNDANHAENRERLRIMRQQSIAMVQLLAKIARVTSGIEQTDVDTMLGKFLMAEVERPD
jgi:Mg2+ and Co2+ transporter CorA